MAYWKMLLSMQKKNGGLEMGFKKWVCSKDGQEHKNLKRY